MATDRSENQTYFYPLGEIKRAPVATTSVRSFWQPFSIANIGTGEESHRFNLNPDITLAEIAGKLPKRFAGFNIGTEVTIAFVDEDLAVDLGSIVETRLSPLIFVPSERAEIVDLGVVEAEIPNLLPFMIGQGVSTALRLPGGLIANNPNVVAIVEQ